ncbi:phosphatase PAP2 family protein [Sphingomonas sp. M6A6_1c]
MAAVAALVGCALLMALALLLRGSVTGLDPVILRWVRERTGDYGSVVTLARRLTILGNDLTLWIVTIAALSYLLAKHRWPQAVYIAGATATGGMMTSAIKFVVDRPRPTLVNHLVEVQSASFPSGHAMNSAYVYGTLALAVAATQVTRPRKRIPVVGALILVLAIGASRIVLGVHWPTDVAAGWAFGLGWTVLAAKIFARVDPGRSGLGQSANSISEHVG